RAAVREEVQPAPAVRVEAAQLAVLALVEEEAGLLPRGRIDEKAQAVLANDRGRLAFADRLRLQRQLLELARREIVLAVDQSRRELALQRRDDERFQLLQCAIRDLDDEHVVVLVDDQSAEVIPLGV